MTNNAPKNKNKKSFSVKKNINKNLNIMSWNANSVRNKQAELHDVLSKYDIDVALLQETFLKSSHRYSIPGYVVYRNDRTPGSGGGTAVLVRKNITHNVLPSSRLNNIEHTSIQIETSSDPIKVTSLYRKCSTHQPDEFLSLVADNSPYIIGGDFNAHHPLWEHSNITPPGRHIVELAGLLGFGLALPDYPTFYPNNNRTEGILDFFILNKINRPAKIRVLNELDSDHRPIILTLGNCHAIEIPLIHFNKKTDWKKYEDYLITSTGPVPGIRTPEQLEEAVLKFTRDITSAYEHATTVLPPSQNRDYSFPVHLQTQITIKNRLNRRARTSRDPFDKSEANRARREVREAVKAWKAERWESLLANQRLEGPTDIWRLSRTLSGKGSDRPRERRAPRD